MMLHVERLSALKQAERIRVTREGTGTGAMVLTLLLPKGAY